MHISKIGSVSRSQYHAVGKFVLLSQIWHSAGPQDMQPTLYNPLNPSFRTVCSRTSDILLYLSGLPPIPCACKYENTLDEDITMKTLKRYLQFIKHNHALIELCIVESTMHHKGLLRILIRISCTKSCMYLQSTSTPTCNRVRTSAKGKDTNCAKVDEHMPVANTNGPGTLPSCCLFNFSIIISKDAMSTPA